MFVKCVR